MSKDEILNMPAGRALDALVHLRVFNGKSNKVYDASGEIKPSWRDGYGSEGTFYSTDIAAAWEVSEKIQGSFCVSRAWRPEPSGELWHGYSCWLGAGGKGISVVAETAPLAICRAALLAIGWQA